MACLAPLGEIIRFQSLIIRDGQLAATQLEGAMTKLAGLSATSRIRSTLRHDLRHLVSGLRSAPNLNGIGTDEIANLVERLIESGQRDQSRTPRAHVADCVKLAFALVSESSNTHSVRLLSSIDRNLTVESDAGDLLLVFLNLFRNSIEAYQSQVHHSGMKTVFVTAVETKEGIEISVEDRAGGVPRSVAERIFLAPRSTKPGGQGLGLLSVRETLLSNNALIVYLPTDEGSVFKLSFLKSGLG